MSNKFHQVGKSVLKVDSLGLACGRSEFTDDLYMHNMLHGKILKSPHAHARIKNIDVSKAEELEGVACVLTHKNVPRVLHTTAGQGFPEPSPYDCAVLDDKVRFVGDRVAVVAAETEEAAEEALGLIEVDYEMLPAVFDSEEALKPGAPIIHDEEDARAVIPVPYEPKKNLAAEVEITVGQGAEAFKECDHVLERVFESHQSSHCMMEPPIAISWIDAQNRIVIRTSTQVPFHVRRIVAQCLQVPVKKIRVIKPRIGGGFGGKQEILVEDVCAFLTLRTGRPVRLAYDREEVFIAGRTRHAEKIWLKTGYNKDGEFKCIDLNVLMDSGAYGSHALTVLCNSGSKTLPMFNKVPHVHFKGRTAYTNKPVGGAYRGYGATQAAFAVGVMMDELAEKMGMDPIEFYKKHAIKPGETSPIFAELGEGKEGIEMTIDSCELERCLDEGAEAIWWQEKRRKNTRKGSWVHGVGMTCLMQGSSIPEIDMASATIKINDDGSFNLLVGATDLGTGSDTILAQIAAETLTVNTDDILVYSSDTDLTPFDVGAYASSTTYLSGNAVRKAAEKIAAVIKETAARMLKMPENSLEIKDKKVVSKNDPGKSVGFDKIAQYALYEQDQFQIMAQASDVSHKSPPPFAAHFAEVAVDEKTGQIKVLQYVAAVDCGTAINPKLAEGQTEGAVVNGLGFALTEEYLYDEKGKMMNANLGDYKIPNITDLPELKVILIPSYEPTGPYGAKSVSEISINGALPVISNAVYNAVGVRLTKSPFTPERVLQAIKEKEKKE